MKNTTTAIVAFSLLPLLSSWQRNHIDIIGCNGLTKYLGFSFIGLFTHIISPFQFRVLEIALIVIPDVTPFYVIKNFLYNVIKPLKREYLFDG
jgi:hypothetical protein